MPSNIDLATKSYLTLLKHDPKSLSLIPEVVQASIDMKKDELNTYRASQLQKLARSKFKRYTVRRDGRQQTTNTLRKNIYDHFARLGQQSVRSSHDPRLEASSLFRDYYIQLFSSNIYHSDGYVKLNKFKDESKIKMLINNLSPIIIDEIIEKLIEESYLTSEELTSLTVNKKRKKILDYYIKPERDEKYRKLFGELFEILNKYFDKKSIKETNWKDKLKFIIDNLDRQLLLRIWNRGLEYKNYYPEYYYDDIHSIYETPGSLYNRSVILENRAGKRRTRKRRTRSR